MKYVLALVVLLPLCYNAKNMTLNTEMIKRLKELNELHKDNKVNFTTQRPLLIPRRPMCKQAYSCLGAFTRELKGFLENMTVPEDHQNLLDELKKNLQLLKPQQQAYMNCSMVPCVDRCKQHTMFNYYVQYLKCLNSSRRR